MFKKTRYLSFLLVITLLVSGMPFQTFAASETPAGGRLQAECKVTDAWGSTYTCSVTLKNISSEKIENWKISGICADNIDSIYDAQIVEHNGTSYIIKNNNWNANINPGETISFEFRAQIEGNEQTDNSLALQAYGLFDIQLVDSTPIPVTVSEKYEVICTITSDWGSGYNASFEIKNKTDKVMENWKLEFDFDQNIDSIWNAQIVSHEGSHYALTNDGWNANIPANGSVTFGCAGSPGNISVKPGNYILHCANDVIEDINDDNTDDNVSDSSLTIHTSAFTPLAEDGTVFYTDQKINALTGTLSNAEHVTAMTFTIKCGNLELVNTSITPAADWSYAAPNLPVMLQNQIIVEAKMKNGTTVEESLILYNICEENFNESLLDTNDNDGDGLLNWLEDVYETDKNSPDTDGDGLTDYQEIFITFTDPFLWDSDDMGISDGEQDFDNDGLNNIQECFYGTNPYSADTDGDGLSDYEEISVYFTDPLEADTDGDGLTDSEELALGLDPFNPATDGSTPDAKRIFNQKISAGSPIFDEINEEDNQYTLSVNLSGAGLAEQHLSVNESIYEHFIVNDAILGKIIDFSYDDDFDFEQANLKFEIKNDSIDSPNSIYAEANKEFEGISRFSFFVFSEEINMPVPVRTEYDLENNTVYTTVQENGTYFVMDVEKWFAMLGIEPDQNISETDYLEVHSADLYNAEFPIQEQGEQSSIFSSVQVQSFESAVMLAQTDVKEADETYTYTDGPAHGQGKMAFRGGVLASNGKIILVPHNSAIIGIYDPETNIYINGPAHGQGSGAFLGGVLAPDGKVILIPSNSSNIGIYDPETNIYTDGPTHGQGNLAFCGGVLAPNGKIILVPSRSANIGIYDPVTNAYTSGPEHGQGSRFTSHLFWGGVLAPNGKIIFVPYNSATIGIYDPVTNTYTNGPNHGRGTGAFVDGVLEPDGKIIFVPNNSYYAGLYDPESNEFNLHSQHNSGLSAFVGGILAPNGKIIFVPRDSITIGIYDPVKRTFAHGPRASGFGGGVLAPNGKIIFLPYDSPYIGILDISSSTPVTPTNPTEYPVILANSFQKIELASPLVRDGKTDTDGDGLIDYEEVLSDSIAWNSDGSVKELPTILEMFGVVSNDPDMGQEVLLRYFNAAIPLVHLERVRVLPVRSSPVDVDSDEDGYSDYDEVTIHHSNPLVSNITVTTLRNPDFLDIVDGTTHYYGGDQGWWEEPEYSGAKNGGCGVVAAANIMSYMSLSDSKYKALYPEDSTLSKTDFLNYMTELLKYVKAPIVGQSLGLTSMQFEDGMMKYARTHGVNMYPAIPVISFKASAEEIVIDYIRSGLKKDKPVGMLNDYNATLKDKYIQYYFLDGSIKSYTFDHHFVTITELREDEISGTASVKVSTWGAYAYIDIQDYMDGFLSSIVYFE